jgi:hypothetical protein
MRYLVVWYQYHTMEPNVYTTVYSNCQNLNKNLLPLNIPPLHPRQGPSPQKPLSFKCEG